MIIYSKSIKKNFFISSKHTCDGSNQSPHLKWKPIRDAKSYVVICTDPDHDNGFLFVHWIVSYIPPHITELKAGAAKKKFIKQGSNSNKVNSYVGPCPDKTNSIHSYYLYVYALDISLKNKIFVSLVQIYDSILGHILASGSIIFFYKRKNKKSLI